MRRLSSLTAFTALAIIAALAVPADAKPPFHQCFTATQSRQKYCSNQTFKSHDPAAEWVSRAIAHFNITGGVKNLIEVTNDPCNGSVICW
jgi:hypothetical protein